MDRGDGGGTPINRFCRQGRWWYSVRVEVKKKGAHMPLLKLHTSAPVPEGKKNSMMAEASRILSEATGKPEKYTMVTLESADVMMAGKPVAAAYVDIRGIGGFTPAVNKKISGELCAMLKVQLGVDPAAVYITFTDVPASNWGWNGGTFG
jgi:phenylpyruvate tautomerase PptA (4-oxalocrotonate tautomerase family)